MNLIETLRLTYVPRWNIVPVSRPQTVAEHSWRVGIIAASLASKLGLDESQFAQCVLYASVHDLGEVRSGDLPTPYKSTLENIHPGIIDKADMAYDSEVTDTRAAFKGTTVGAVVKIADYVEAIHYLDLWGVGTYAHRVKGGLEDRMNAYCARKTEEFKINFSIPANNLLMEIRTRGE